MKPYTDDDIRTATKALVRCWDYRDAHAGSDARAVLDALAAAGRLLPAEAWAVPKVPVEHSGWVTAKGRVVSMVFDPNEDTMSPTEAREFAALYLAAADAAEAQP